MWDFSTEPAFQEQLDWIDQFVRERVEPLDHILGSQWNIHDPNFEKLVRPLQAEVKERGLWACHLSPEQGGKGYGQVKLALMNELLDNRVLDPLYLVPRRPIPATGKY